MTSASLYLCYQSIAEPLTQTQVVAYLEGLAQAGYRMLLLTFEPRPLTAAETQTWQQRMKEKGIRWQWCRYHKRPTVPATAWDILVGIVIGLQLIRRHRVRLIHARNHVPGLMGWVLKRLTGVKLLFDLRGFMAEEYVDAGVWPANGWLFRLTKRVERHLVRAANGIVILTQSGRKLLGQWYPAEVNAKLIQVIPCCVDLRAYPRSAAICKPWPGPDQAPTLLYAGKLGGSYHTQALVQFFRQARDKIPALRLRILSQSDPKALLPDLNDLNGVVSVAHASPQDMPRELAQAHLGLCFYRPGLSMAGRSPTKSGEYLAAGMPIICNAGIGDLDALPAQAGIILADLCPDAFAKGIERMRQLLLDREVPERCRDLAEEELDLARTGWSHYRRMYHALFAKR